MAIYQKLEIEEGIVLSGVTVVTKIKEASIPLDFGKHKIDIKFSLN